MMSEFESRIKKLYSEAGAKIDFFRKKSGRPLSLTEKIFATHVTDLKSQDFQRGTSYLSLRPDRVAMQDATAQMALLQFMLAGCEAVAVPSTIHCDHLILARVGAVEETKTALDANR